MQPEILGVLPNQIAEEILRKANRIQLDLAQDSGLELEDWIEENAEDFRDYLNEHQDLLDLYAASDEKVKQNLRDTLVREMRKMQTIH